MSKKRSAAICSDEKSTKKAIALSQINTKQKFNATYDAEIIDSRYEARHVFSYSEAERLVRRIIYDVAGAYEILSVKNETCLYPLIYHMLSNILHISGGSVSSRILLEFTNEEDLLEDETVADETISIDKEKDFQTPELLNLVWEKTLKTEKVSGFVEFVVEERNGMQ